ncbi:MAG: ATP-binding protein, partial [Muribaculaceae bacterium]|nr:ATP-binding protein [Muribaculaceae bacterium]
PLHNTFNVLKDRYDGYHFSKSLLDVYNPLSLMSALARREIADYWNLTGSPSLLLKILQESPLNIKELNHARASAEMLENISAFNINPIALFYQTGYLTIKDYDRETRLFTLGYPNKEVESGLMNNLLSIYGNVSDSTMLVSDLKRCLDKGEVEHFISLLKSFFADIPFDLRKNIGKYENYYHTIFYVLLRLLGIETHAEYHTSEGSIDVMIKTSLFIYIIEIKINGSASDAIEQINSRSYDAPFATDPRTKIKLGIGFSDKTHNIDSYLIET